MITHRADKRRRFRRGLTSRVPDIEIKTFSLFATLPLRNREVTLEKPIIFLRNEKLCCLIPPERNRRACRAIFSK